MKLFFILFWIDLCNVGVIVDSGNINKGRCEILIWWEIKMVEDESFYFVNFDEFVNDEDKIVSFLLVYGKSNVF